MLLCVGVVIGEDTRDEGAIKDQQREGCARIASDHDPSNPNPPFDEILPHILNM